MLRVYRTMEIEGVSHKSGSMVMSFTIGNKVEDEDSTDSELASESDDDGEGVV